ncbi:MAG: hypothetical protein K5931_03925 [Lachnospiraceae bacterium]|nr:hypothetical protein [Lachnospiraceae bacterium]
MKRFYKLAVSFVVMAIVAVVPTKAATLEQEQQWLQNMIASNVARAEAWKAQQEATYAKQREAFSNELAKNVKAVEADQAQRLEKALKESANWNAYLDNLHAKNTATQWQYNRNFLNEIYKAACENVRVKDEVVKNLKYLVTVNPNFKAGLEEAEKNYADACAMRDDAKARLNAFDATK